MRSRRGAPLALKLAAGAGLLYLHLPMAFILLYAFTTDNKSYAFPPPGLTLRWFAVAWERQDIGSRWSRPRSHSCWARSPRRRSIAPASSAARRSRS